MTNAQEKDRPERMYMAIEVSQRMWKLAFTDLKRERLVEVAAWDMEGFGIQVEAAKRHLGLAEDAEVDSCYEAGRDGFSIHRFLEAKGIRNVVVDPASIEVSRRKRRRKTDRLDAKKLLRRLVRYHVYGDEKCWQVCRVPSLDQEAARRLDREHERLKKERTSHICRLRSLLALHGVKVQSVYHLQPGQITDWSGRILEPTWQEEIGREQERLRLVDQQLGELHTKMKQSIQKPRHHVDRVAKKLHCLKSIGVVGATALSQQFFGWRVFENVRQVGAAAGLTGCPYDSGDSSVEQGISKVGSRRIRTLTIELAWMWLRFQPKSALSQWYERRFAHGGRRQRRIGIVAMARKLLVALWKWLRFDQMPEGAQLRAGPWAKWVKTAKIQV